MKLLQLLFYKFYTLSRYIGSNETSSIANAWLNTVIVLWLNLFFVQMFIELYILNHVVRGIINLILGVLTGAFVYFLLAHKKDF